MFLHKLKLSSFRNYFLADALFTRGINYIEGENGSGKSNLLEAISFLSTGKSFRTSKPHDLIQHTQNAFVLEVHFIKEEINHKLCIFLSKEGKKIVYNDTPYTNFLPLLGLIPSIFISPEDIHIVTGGPAERRRFLDLHIAQEDSQYVYHLGRYQRALKSRNLLLKSQSKGLSSWEELLSISASYIVQKRIKTLTELQTTSRQFILHLSEQQEPLEMHYVSSFSVTPENLTKDFYVQKFAEMRPKELLYKTTLIGPHRDDIFFSIHGQEVKSFYSEGQKRCCLAALRLAQWEVLKKRLGFPPLFGIDDFGIHLDANRSDLLKQLLKNMGQVFLTAPSFSSKDAIHLLQASNGTLFHGDLLDNR